MNVYSYRTDARTFDLGLRCPRCHRNIGAHPISAPFYKISDVSDEIAYVVCQCPMQDCSTIMMVEYDRLNNQVARVHPRPEISASNYHEAIPRPIREDFAEAVKCQLAHAHKGVVVMCRRAMQNMMLDKGATKDKLEQQIDEIHSKGLITEPLKKAAHEVRHFGNFGSHPRDDGLDNITHDDADSVLAITQNFMNALYVQPAEVEKLERKRKPSQGSGS